MRTSLLSVLCVLTASVGTAYGWGAAGHEIVATIAQIHLHPTVFPNICAILNFTSTNPNEPQCHLAPIAAWADKLKYRMRWSAPLHYIGALDDYPSKTCLFPGDRGWAGRKGGNLLAGIRNVSGILEDWVENDSTGSMMDAGDESANEALKFLVHFLGDMHMPLHLTGRDRGGNSNKVTFGGRTTNLHSLWDGLLIAKALRTVPRNYSYPLPSPQIEFALRGTIYDSFVRRIMWEGVLGKWRDEIPSWLACPAPAAAQPSSMWQQVMSVWNRLSMTGIAQETDDDIICPFHWSAPIHALNCEIVWPPALDEPPYSNGLASDASDHAPHDCHGSDEAEEGGEFTDAGKRRPHSPYLELDTPEYSGVISSQWILEKLLAQGGIRLAGILNYLFADFEEGERELYRRGLSVPLDF